MATTAEKYQLKWHSHVANLNSSVVNLFRNEKFADVLLMTSNPNETCGLIPAHKIILSACSHYFSSIFESSSAPSAPNSIIYVILPPELTKRALEILVQYIYCGEATVHNDILNEVLKGGELLKIRGLWRSSGSSDYLDHHYTTRTFAQPSVPPPPPPHPGQPSSSQGTSHLMHPSTSSGREARIQIAYDRERPMVIRNQPTERSPVRPAYYPPSVYVKKDIGRDPGSSSSGGDCETCRITLQSTSEGSNEGRQTPQMPMNEQSTIHQHHHHHQPAHQLGDPPQSFINSSAHSSTDSYRGSLQKSVKPFFPSKSSASEPHPDPSSSVSSGSSRQQFHPLERDRERQIIVHQPSSHSSASSYPPPIPPVPHPPPREENPSESIVAPIKQEPQDWPDEFEQKPHVEVPVKREVIFSEDTHNGGISGGEEAPCLNRGGSSGGGGGSAGPLYTPLTCELCKETFNQPADWVRHIENHAETPQTVPKKRRRTEEMNENIASLKCDLCSMYFLMPADWVRHIQKTHTETELAVSNTMAKASSFSGQDPHLVDLNNCVVCTNNKSSYQTPTGEPNGSTSSSG